MIKRFGLIAILCALLATPAAAAPPPLSAYGQLPAVEHMSLSPNGQMLAYVAVKDGKRQLIVQTLDGGALQDVATDGFKLRAFEWAGDDHLIIFASNTMHLGWRESSKYEWMNVACLNIKTHKMLPLLKKGSAFGNVLGYYGTRSIEGRWYGYIEGQQVWGAGRQNGVALFKVDLDDGSTVALAEAGPRAYDWTLDDQGRIIARSAFDRYKNLWSLSAGERSDRTIFSRQSATADLNSVSLGRTVDTILVEDQSGDEDTAYEVPLDGKSKPQVLFDGIATTQKLFARDRPVLIGGVDTMSGQTNFFDPKLQERFEAARKPFAKYHVKLVSYDTAFSHLILFTEGGDDSGSYWFVDLTNHKARSLGEAYPDVGPTDVGATSLVRYKAADGLSIEGVLTLPPGANAVNLPLVVLPHGGPLGIADKVGFDWWAQAFASRGYAVLQPNYRGSGSYGAAFRRAGFGEWGRKMQTDLSDGVAHLVGLKMVDPKRVCIVGGSYGGYAALAGVTLQHGIYRCAVSYGGVSDLGATLARTSRRGDLTARREQRAMGATWAGDPGLRAHSPLAQAAQADAPILLIHGKDDTVVPVSESEWMDSALRAAGKEHVFLSLAGEDHWLSSAETRTRVLQASVDFVVKSNPPG